MGFVTTTSVVWAWQNVFMKEKRMIGDQGFVTGCCGPDPKKSGNHYVALINSSKNPIIVENYIWVFFLLNSENSIVGK